MRFVGEERLFDLFPGLAIGVLVCEIENVRYADDELDIVVGQLRNGFPYEKPQEHPRIKVWREAFGKLGISASKYYSSIESLVRRVLKGGSLPRINPVVDLYNTISLKYLVPMGGHALEPIRGDITLGFASGGEPFTPMDTNTKEFVEKGEVVYKDEEEILTRRWVWRQCEKDKVTKDTKKIFIPVDIMEGLPESLCQSVMDDFEDNLIRNKYGTVLHRAILTKENISTEFTA